MTDELISKTDVVKIVKSVLSPASSLTNVARARRQMLNEINELESKPEPKRGRWVLVCDNNGMHFICNKCGAWRYHQEQKFCGECGADMRQKGEDNESN